MKNIENGFVVCNESKTVFIKPVSPFKNEGFYAELGPSGAAVFDEDNADVLISALKKDLNILFIRIPALEIVKCNPINN